VAGGRVPVLAAELDAERVLDGLPVALLVLDSGLRIRFVNAAAEQFLARSRRVLSGRPLASLLAPHVPLLGLLERVHTSGRPTSGYALELVLERGARHLVDVHVAPLEETDELVLLLQPSPLERGLGRELLARDSSDAVAGLAAMLAHEVKNPLSGIKGAAQLLEPQLDEADRALARLICEETDRICRLVEEMEGFSDLRPFERRAVNVHLVLEHVRRIAEAGFGRHLRFEEAYDPSLLPVHGDQARLVQLFLNLVKNAAEAVPPEDGRVILRTRFHHGYTIRVGAGGHSPELPIVVEIEDNGPGVPEELRDRIFEPFVSTKPGGKGLGLALAARIAREHGGFLACGDGAKGAVFRVHLPACSEAGDPGEE